MPATQSPFPDRNSRNRRHEALPSQRPRHRQIDPRIPGDGSSFVGAQRIDIDTWELDLNALRQGNYRNDPNDILFIVGPVKLPDVIFGNGFQ